MALDSTIESRPFLGRFGRWFWPSLMLAAVMAGIWAVHHELRQVHYHDLVAELGNLGGGQVAKAIALALAAYAVLPGYDAIALSAIGKPIAAYRVVFSSFIAYSMSQTLGFPLLTGGSVRYRFWSHWGLNSTEIASAMSYVAATFTIGLVAVTGVVLIAEPRGTAALLRLPIPSLWPVGVLCLVLVAAYLGRCLVRREPLVWRGWHLPIPPFRLAVAQLVVAGVDWILAAAVLHVLLPPSHGLAFPALLGAFMVAQFAAIVSHVPGGLGVFEGIMVVLLRPYLEPPSVIGALLAFRAVYYLLPFGIGLLLLGISETFQQRTQLAVAAERAGRFANVLTARWIPGLLPFVLGGAAFGAGVILLVSGATPSIHSRVRFLDDLLPLGVIELSHFVASLAGGGLIVLGWALTRRLDAAYRLTQGLLGIGIVTSLLKGLDWEEAAALTVVFLLLLPAHRFFYRRAALTGEPFSPGWIVAIVAVLTFAAWLGLFSYKHLAFSTELWWQFTAHGDAPRYLRAMIGVMVPVATFAFARLFRHTPVEAKLPDAADIARAAVIAKGATSGVANLALLGDKALHFSDTGGAFLMYGVAGRSWVAMGDPIGPEDEQRELVWTFREMVDRHGGWTVFYEASRDYLPLYVDLGLTLLKLGEEAIVSLADFGLEGGHRRGLRRTRKDVLAAGAGFAIEPIERVSELLPDLKAISDQWLEAKHAREKGFSLGRFDEAYLRWFPVAVVRIEGRIVAFANLWCAPAGGELSMDLMRYSSAAPDGVMTFLFIEMMLWGKANGYRTFNLGMAPLSGLESRALAPLWTKAGAFLSRHGESVYHFQGLRQFKEKFDPVWRSKYLASPAGLALPRILTNVASLISGGLTGILRK